MIRTDFKRRTINTYTQQQSAQQQNAAASATYATSPSHFNGGASTSSLPNYSYQTQRSIPVYPVQQKVALPSTSYSIGQKRPAQPLTGHPIKRVVGNTTFRPVSNTTLLQQGYRK